MSLVRIPGTLETDRLILRYRAVTEAAIYRQPSIVSCGPKRDQRVPPHRRIDLEGRPTVEDVAAQIRAEGEGSASGLLAVARKDAGDVVGYCGPDLAWEWLAR